MKKFDLNTFIFRFTDELRQFEETQTIHASSIEKTMEEWVESFLVYSGHAEEADEELFTEEYDDDFYYGDSFEYQELVNRRKYKSFRDDDRY